MHTHMLEHAHSHNLQNFHTYKYYKTHLILDVMSPKKKKKKANSLFFVFYGFPLKSLQRTKAKTIFCSFLFIHSKCSARVVTVLRETECRHTIAFMNHLCKKITCQYTHTHTHPVMHRINCTTGTAMLQVQQED